MCVPGVVQVDVPTEVRTVETGVEEYMDPFLSHTTSFVREESPTFIGTHSVLGTTPEPDQPYSGLLR